MKLTIIVCDTNLLLVLCRIEGIVTPVEAIWFQLFYYTGQEIREALIFGDLPSDGFSAWGGGVGGLEFYL